MAFYVVASLLGVPATDNRRIQTPLGVIGFRTAKKARSLRSRQKFACGFEPTLRLRASLVGRRVCTWLLPHADRQTL